ncbi:unnamed protein product [Hymenolepis diminuta]|uniref:Uncharacterized protein n=1 Tax=Hymenolepis diminuta TaxID=6216 RepID=A0A564Z195_HYMDI|nr:unnamed protein product [Hymenolepis diminuta]
MSFSTSIVHSLPVNIDADGATLEIPRDFVKASASEGDAQPTLTAHLRGRKLFGKAFEMPLGSEAIVVQNEDMHSLEEGTGNVRVAGTPVEKLIIWNTDAPSDVSEKIRSALLWSKLNAALSE